MTESVKVPGFGSVDRKKALLIGGVIVVVAGVGYWRYRQTAATPASGGNNIDPATGFEYGSAEDLDALAAQQQADQEASQIGAGGIVDTNGQNNPNVTTSFVSNAAWEQAAVSTLSGQGQSPHKVSPALGKYLAARPVDDAERSLIDQATAAVGLPPVAGPGGYPPHIHAEKAGPPPKVLSPITLRVAHKDKKTAVLDWDVHPNATAYIVHHHAGASHVTRKSRITVKRPGEYWVVATRAGWTSSTSNHVKV